MRVLVACEYSGRVRDAFLRRGHDAMSCDLLPTDVPGPHYQGDVRDVLDPPRGWKLVKFSADLLGSGGEPEDCPEHGIDFADCECYGPTQDGIAYQWVDGFLFGRPEGEAGKPTWGNQTPSGQNKLGPSPDRWKIRSATYPAVAEAMAAQWGGMALGAVA